LTIPSKSQRIEGVDALRGFALTGIFLLHNIEHFNLYDFPEAGSPALKALDKATADLMFFLFADKTYSIFALLFGYSFFLMFHQNLGWNAGARRKFGVRLLCLFFFGILGASFYMGEILTLYSITGFSLFFFSLLPTRWLPWVVAFLLIKPVDWVFLGLGINPWKDLTVNIDASWNASLMGMKSTSFFDLVLSNLTDGKFSELFWSWGTGRVSQISGLFGLGFFLGRKGFFLNTEENAKRWTKGFLIFFISCLIFFAGREGFKTLFPEKELMEMAEGLWARLGNLSQTFAMVGLFLLCYRNLRGDASSPLARYGKMSLTFYVLQSVMGALVYYGFGLNTWNHLTTLPSLGVGLLFLGLQITFAGWWLRTHRQGPLEGWLAGVMRKV
jgi:uncharacterized protein